MENHYAILLSVLYGVIVCITAIKIISDTSNPQKSLAFLTLIIAFPVLGIVFYFIFGVDYRRKNFYDYEIKYNKKQLRYIKNSVQQDSNKVLEDNPSLNKYDKIILSVLNSIHAPITPNNEVKLLINGENKFELVKKKLKEAKHHIHLMYYIYDDDVIGNEIADILIEKKQQGVMVRLLYDFWGSRKVGNIPNKLKSAGIEVYPINKFKFTLLAYQRVNYRDHRKILIIDGEEAFIGGINVGDNYINSDKNKKQLYWRDTHLYIRGKGVYYLQFLFWSTYCFIRKESYGLSEDYFKFNVHSQGESIVQVTASGPDYKELSIEETILSAIYSATQRIYITTPYFIPSESIRIALLTAVHSGVDVILLVPYKGDSSFVNAASRSYYQQLLEGGIKVHLYKKGFVHAKTMVIDYDCSVVGTANMDIRSMELNFEVNVTVFDKEINSQLAENFFNDLQHSKEIKLSEWKNRNKIEVFIEKIIRLFSPIL